VTACDGEYLWQAVSIYRQALCWCAFT
jgi:hypothetical protein